MSYSRKPYQERSLYQRVEESTSKKENNYDSYSKGKEDSYSTRKQGNYKHSKYDYDQEDTSRSNYSTKQSNDYSSKNCKI